MADGSERPIEDVKLGEHVLTAEGRTGRVVRTMLRDEDGGLLRLILWGHSHLRLTREHPVLTARGYVPASQLQVGDEVALPRYVAASRDYVATAEHVTNPDHRLVRSNRWTGVRGRRGLSANAHALPEKIDLDAGFGRLIGLFLAEGNCDSAKVTWTFADHEADTLATEVAELMSRYGVTVHAKLHAQHHTCRVVVHGTAWTRLFSALCGDGAGMKRLHPQIAAGPAEFLAAMLSGWLAGDGTTRPGGEREGITISADLALGMYDIAQALGHHPTLVRSEPVMNRHAATRQPRWTLSLAKGPGRCRQDDGHVWRKVREVRLEDYVGPVYDLTVEGDHSYVAEGVGVHNCTGNAMTGALGTGPLFAALPAGLVLDEDEALKLYSEAETIDGDGPYPPSDNGSTGPSVAKAAEDDGLISGFTHYTDLDSTLQALMDGPVILGVNWYSSFDTPDADGTVSITADAYVRGGHEVLARVVDTAAQMIGLDNSWGTSYGVNGSFRMSYATLERLLAENGDCTAPEPLKAPVPAPPSPQPPSPQPKPDWWDEFINWIGHLF